MNELLLYFALKYHGDFYAILNALKIREKADEHLKRQLFSGFHGHYITLLDAAYPEAFKHIDCPPFVLFYYGDIRLLQKKAICITGTRYPNYYGDQVTKEFVTDLVKQGYLIVSGMGTGVERRAHLSAIRAGGHTIGVLANGIETITPTANLDLYTLMKDTQLIISEYPGMREPTTFAFRCRNRLMTGLSEQLLVTQCELKSGAMICVSDALEQGKDVAAVPGRITDPPGTNCLISQGAKLVSCANDLAEEY